MTQPQPGEGAYVRSHAHAPPEEGVFERSDTQYTPGVSFQEGGPPVHEDEIEL